MKYLIIFLVIINAYCIDVRDYIENNGLDLSSKSESGWARVLNDIEKRQSYFYIPANREEIEEMVAQLKDMAEGDGGKLR